MERNFLIIFIDKMQKFKEIINYIFTIVFEFPDMTNPVSIDRGRQAR